MSAKNQVTIIISNKFGQNLLNFGEKNNFVDVLPLIPGPRFINFETLLNLYLTKFC